VVRCVHRRQLRCERVLANAGCAWMLMRAVGWGGCARGCSGWWGFARGASRGAAVRAVNDFGDDGAASLAPSLGRMAQLTALDLRSTLRCVHRRPAALRAGACERRRCADDAACCGLGRLGAVVAVVGDLQGASRGAAVRSGNRIGADGAASLAPSLVRMTQLTALDLRGTLRASAASCAVSGCLRTPAVHR
jgi:hypothetical protein